MRWIRFTIPQLIIIAIGITTTCLIIGAGRHGATFVDQLPNGDTGLGAMGIWGFAADRPGNVRVGAHRLLFYPMARPHQRPLAAAGILGLFF